MKIAFAGTPEFAQVALKALLEAGHDVRMVLTQPDRPAGRGMKLQASPVKQTAEEAGIPVHQPVSLKKGEDGAAAIQALRTCCDGHPPQVLVVAAYGLLLPQSVLDIPSAGCLNIHGSLLPRWRGAAPIHRAIEAGDDHTGITIMKMDIGLDTGDMGLIEPCPIGPQDTTATLHDRLAQVGGKAIVAALARLAAGQLQWIPQPEDGVTYAHKILKHESLLNFAESAPVLARRLRAFDPFPGGQCEWSPASGAATQTLKLWSAQARTLPAHEAACPVGEVIAVHADGVLVRCGEGALLLTVLQKPGGKRAPAYEVARGLGVQPGDRFFNAVNG